MDEQGVGPCGHVAKEKDILVKVFASCLAHEIPMEKIFSIHCAENNKITWDVTDYIEFRSNMIYDGQHPSGLDFTEVRCKNKIDQPCTMAPGSTWQQWSFQERLFLVQGEDNSQPVWYYVFLVDDEETIQMFKEKTQGAAAGMETIRMTDFGEIVQSGWGQTPTSTKEDQEWSSEYYFINYDYGS